MTKRLLTTALGRTFLLLLLLTHAGCSGLRNDLQLGDILRGVLPAAGTELDAETVGAGLRQALRVGTERAVDATSATDGFLANELIRIVLPEQLEPMARGLRTVGLGSQIDAFEISMNRAAEATAGEAQEVLSSAISQMTLTDVFEILNGADTAATDYFRDHTEDSLRTRFRPIVSAKMANVGLYKLYDGLVTRYAALPFVSKPTVDLDGYITDKTLDGLFAVLAQEEKRIREDPAARTTDLLHRVFGERLGAYRSPRRTRG